MGKAKSPLGDTVSREELSCVSGYKVCSSFWIKMTDLYSLFKKQSQYYKRPTISQFSHQRQPSANYFLKSELHAFSLIDIIYETFFNNKQKLTGKDLKRRVKCTNDRSFGENNPAE